MSHEMRLYSDGGRCWAYCGCGWIGQAWDADRPWNSASDFQDHLDALGHS